MVPWIPRTVKETAVVFTKKPTFLRFLHYFRILCHTWPSLPREGSLWHCLIFEQLSHLSDLHTRMLEI